MPVFECRLRKNYNSVSVGLTRSLLVKGKLFRRSGSVASRIPSPCLKGAMMFRAFKLVSKLRASKSMQNLEQITRDSLYNLKNISSNLKQKYNSRMELRQQSQMYNKLWDNDADDVDEVDFYHRLLVNFILICANLTTCIKNA